MYYMTNESKYILYFTSISVDVITNWTFDTNQNACEIKALSKVRLVFGSDVFFHSS